MFLRKSESSLEKKIVSAKYFFSGEWKSSKKKESLQDEGSDTKYSVYGTWV